MVVASILKEQAYILMVLTLKQVALSEISVEKKRI